MECKVCQKSFDTRNKFHRHFKKCCDKTQKQYYETFFPRFDLWDHSVIEYKDFNQYFAAQFNSKENTLCWYKDKASSGNEEARQVARAYFSNKLFQKAPTQAELRCKKIPSIIGLDKIFGSYYQFCDGIGLSPRLTNRDISYIKDVDIVTDTREQLPVFTDRVEKLEVGDYTTYCDFNGVFVERKSLDDFIGTFSRKDNFDRFERELKRAEELGLFLVIVCDSDFEAVASWKNPHAGGRSCGFSALSKMCDFMQQFDNCQFLFIKKGRDFGEILKKILGIGELAKTTDLQYLHDTNQF